MQPCNEDVGQQRIDALKDALAQFPNQKAVTVARTHLTALLQFMDTHNALRHENNRLHERVRETKAESAHEIKKLKAQVRYYEKVYGQKWYKNLKNKQ